MPRCQGRRSCNHVLAWHGKFDISEIMQNLNIVNPSPKKSECRIISYKNHLISNSCVFLPGEFPKISPVKKHASIRTRPDSLSRSPSFRPGYSRGLSFDPSVCLKTHAMFSLARTDQEGQPSNSPGPGKHPMQGEAPDNPARPHSLAQERIPCSFSDCSWDFSHDAKRRMQGRAMSFPEQGIPSWTKVARDVAGILRDRGISATFFLQTGPQAVLQGTTPVPATACSPHGELMNETSNMPEDGSENTNLLALLRDDTICAGHCPRPARGNSVHGAALRLFAQKSHGTPFAQAQHLPERFYRNACPNSREMARQLES